MMKVIEILEEQEGQYQDLQNLINQTEEDLLCAIYLLRHCKKEYQPVPNICYLLHQTIEKWLKIYIQVEGIPFPENKQKTHSLTSLFSRIIGEDTTHNFNSTLSQLDKADPMMTAHAYPEYLRYATKPEMYDSVYTIHMRVLCNTAFRVRRITKQVITKRLDVL